MERGLRLSNERNGEVMKPMMKRNRKYAGQPHTDYGKRGKRLVEGLTMRDICDCYVRGVLLASYHLEPTRYSEACKGEKARLNGNDLFGFDLDRLDPLAIQQNMMCEVEKMMGIFPNIPKPKKRVKP